MLPSELQHLQLAKTLLHASIVLTERVNLNDIEGALRIIVLMLTKKVCNFVLFCDRVKPKTVEREVAALQFLLQVCQDADIHQLQG